MIIIKTKEYIFENDVKDYGFYVSHIKEIMDKNGITISRMRRITGLHRNTIRNLYDNDFKSINVDAFAKITYVLTQFGCKPEDLFEYIPANKVIDIIIPEDETKGNKKKKKSKKDTSK